MKLGFIDIEASGLSEDSFPLEIGWTIDGDYVESFLVKPDKQWNINSWSNEAKKLHNIELKDVIDFGNENEKIAKKMNEDLEGFVLLSDSVSHDIRWVNMIFSASLIERKFKIVSIEKFLKRIGLSDKDIFESFQFGREQCPPNNTVTDDAKFLYFSTSHALKKSSYGK